MPIKVKLGLILVGLGVVFIAVFGVLQYNELVNDARERAKETAMEHIERSVEMFMVSTRRFHDEFE